MTGHVTVDCQICLHEAIKFIFNVTSIEFRQKLTNYREKNVFYCLTLNYINFDICQIV